jgi:hypothetical protein
MQKPSSIYRTSSHHRKVGDDPFEYAEVQLTVPVEEFLICRWDWEDLYAFVSGDGNVLHKILWITDNTFLTFDDLCEIIHDYDYDNFSFPLHAYYMATSCCWEPMLTIF